MSLLFFKPSIPAAPFALFAVLCMLAGCASDCAAPECQMSVTAGPGDGAYVVGGLEATAAAFEGPRDEARAGAGDTASASTGGFPRLQLNRDALSPGSATPFSVTRNRSFGLRAEVSRPLSQRPALRGYAAMGVAMGQHDFMLPEGLGPLIDPMTVEFRTVTFTPEAGLSYTAPVPFVPLASLRLTVGAGVELTRTRTHLTSALLDVASRDDAATPFASVGAGLMLNPSGRANTTVELASHSRLRPSGRANIHLEARLSH